MLTATRITAAKRRGSSRPIVVDTTDGPKLVKLRGAAQGTLALAAEMIVAELAEAIGLNVPRRSLLHLSPDVETADWDDEFADLLDASAGVNLGFDYLDGARDVVAGDLRDIPTETKTRILWLDRLVMNPDRTAHNPNLLLWNDRPWLIDHGASLGFQYNWSLVSEQSPREAGLMPEPHLFEQSQDELRSTDQSMAARLTRDVIQRAVDLVPDTFLTEATADARRRRRAAYAAYLGKRLAAPRSFLEARPPGSRPRSPPPEWLKQR